MDGCADPPPESLELDELLVTVVVDNATDTLSSIAEGIPQRPEAAHLLGGPAVGTHEGHAIVAVFEQLCVACHGFSALLTGRRGDDTATVLFDVGPSARRVAGQRRPARHRPVGASPSCSSPTGTVTTRAGYRPSSTRSPRLAPTRDDRRCWSTYTRTDPTAAGS